LSSGETLHLLGVKDSMVFGSTAALIAASTTKR
jgi:hypothetical protein